MAEKGTGDNTSLFEISIQKVKPGMVLGRDLRDSKGRLVIRAGVPLRDTEIRFLHQMKVTTLEIQRDTTPKTGVRRYASDRADIPDWRQEMDRRFRVVVYDPQMQELKQIVGEVFFGAEPPEEEPMEEVTNDG